VFAQTNFTAETVTEALDAKFVFYPLMDWKPMQRALLVSHDHVNEDQRHSA